MKALVVGEHEPAAALTGALLELGVEAELAATHAEPDPERLAGALGESLRKLEARMEADRPDVAVAVSVGDAPLALALAAAKLGVPLLTCQREEPAGELAAAEWRILRELAEASLEMPGERFGADAVAERVAAAARGNQAG